MIVRKRPPFLQRPKRATDLWLVFTCLAAVAYSGESFPFLGTPPLWLRQAHTRRRRIVALFAVDEQEESSWHPNEDMPPKIDESFAKALALEQKIKGVQQDLRRVQQHLQEVKEEIKDLKNEVKEELKGVERGISEFGSAIGAAIDGDVAV